MKKILSAILALAMIASLALCFASCDSEVKTVTKDNIKIGLITIHDDSSTYDKNFIDSMKAAVANLGLRDDQLVITSGVPEDENCYNEAKKLANDGCDVIFADSFGHESWMLQAAAEFPNVTFAHGTGTMAHTEKADNFSNAFASIYEGRYLAGIAAGMKLQQMIDAGTITADQAIVGYVGAYPYAEVKSGYTAWFLGVRAIVPSAKMVVRFTNSWYDQDLEYSTAVALIETDKCVIISQHADSMGAPNACEERNVPNVTYNGTTEPQCPKTYLVASKINWTPYFEALINSKINGTKMDYDYTGTLADGMVEMIALGAAAAPGTQEKMDEAVAALKAGTLNVFDCSKFTVGGQTLTEYMADVDTDEAWAKDTQVIINGIFQESKFRSAPYFDIDIDGIEIKNK